MSHRAFTCLAVGVVVVCGWAGPTAGAETRTGGVSPPTWEVLSRGVAFSNSAHPVRTSRVRVRPSRKARIIDRLRLFTEDGFAEIYLLLLRRTTRHGTWIRIGLPGRPNGRKGWVPRSALGGFRRSTGAVVINRAARRLTFFRGGRVSWSAPAGIGAPGTPTPAGRFWVREQFPVRPGSIYGSYAFGTSAYSRLSEWPGGGVIGIHGTDSPWLIPGRPSHGCIRLRNAAIRRLAGQLTTGATVLIR